MAGYSCTPFSATQYQSDGASRAVAHATLESARARDERRLRREAGVIAGDLNHVRAPAEPVTPGGR